MSGGGGGGPSTTTGTTYSSNLPEYAKPYYEELLKQTGKQVYTTDSDGVATGVQGFNPYGGDRLASFTDQQKTLQDQVAGLSPTMTGFTTGTANVGTGTDLGLNTAATGIGRALGYDASAIDDLAMADRAEFDATAATKYMDPYQANVTDVLKEDARRDAAIAKSGRGLGAINRGTFGGGRQALMEGQADRDLQTTLAKIGYQGEQDAFKFAADQFERDQGRTLATDQANLQADIDARRLTQEIASLDYQQFKEAEDYEKNQLQYMSDILRGNAGALGSTNVQYAAAPSLASQIGGGVAGIAGLYGALGGLS